MPQTTPQLTRAIASGDSEAFARFYEQWFNRMFTWAFTAHRDEDFALDVVQDAMMRVIRNIPTLDNEAILARWLRLTVQSCACDAIRREIRLKKRERNSTQPDLAPQSEDLAEQLEWLQDELRAMQPELAGLLIMRHRWQWTLHRIGTALGIGTGAADRRVRTAELHLQERAKEVFDD